MTVGLPADHDSSGSTHLAVSPCCQCASMRVRPGTAPRVAKVPVRKSRDSGSPQREIHVPEWVAYSVYPKEEMLESRTQAFAVPRCIRLPREDRPLPQLQGLSRFRTGVAPCRCVVSELLLYSSHDSLRALHELKCFIHRLLYYVLWAALELTRTCAPWLRQAVSAGTLRICCNTLQGRSTMKRSLTWSRDCSQFCGRPCCHTVLSLGL